MSATEAPQPYPNRRMYPNRQTAPKHALKRPKSRLWDTW